MSKRKNLIVAVYTTTGDKYLAMTDQQILDLSHMLQTEEDPIPMFNDKEQLYVVGIMIQGRRFTDYPRIIAVQGKEKSNEKDS